jgi:hypothetical protein
MSEGDFTPPFRRPKPFTRDQLRKMKELFARANERIDEVKKLEQKHQSKDIENPEWL